jgi:hypothetical protein
MIDDDDDAGIYPIPGRNGFLMTHSSGTLALAVINTNNNKYGSETAPNWWGYYGDWRDSSPDRVKNTDLETTVAIDDGTDTAAAAKVRNISIPAGKIRTYSFYIGTGDPADIMDVINSMVKATNVTEKINALPSPIQTRDDADKVADATNAYNALSDYEKSLIPQDIKDMLAAAQEQAGQVNHTHGDNSVSGDLPWYIRVVVSPLSETDPNYSSFLDKLGNKNLLGLYDIKLLNTLTGDEYEIPAGESVTVQLGAVDLTGVEDVVVVHQKKDGTIEAINAATTGNKVTFLASSLSLYGVINEVIDPQTGL